MRGQQPQLEAELIGACAVVLALVDYAYRRWLRPRVRSAIGL